MSEKYPSDVAFTDTVKEIQAQKGSRNSYNAMEKKRGWQTIITPELESFLAQLDMFYFGTSNGLGQPYIQYRGGSPGFLRVLDDTTLGFADFSGNRQYITIGNLQENDKAFIFLMDYVNSRRIKLWGRARVIEDDPELLQKLDDPGYDGHAERAIIFDVAAWDVNCPQHIHKRLPLKTVQEYTDMLQARIAELEEKLKAMKD